MEFRYIKMIHKQTDTHKQVRTPSTVGEDQRISRKTQLIVC